MGAARRKGKWVGGRPFLGYDIAPGGGALVVNEAEATQVQKIFKLYLSLQSLQATVAELNHRGMTMKQWRTQKGTLYGGDAFTKSSLHGMLTNVAYIGEVNYRGHVAQAEFPDIIEPELFKAVQQCLKENNQCSGARVSSSQDRCPEDDGGAFKRWRPTHSTSTQPQDMARVRPLFQSGFSGAGQGRCCNIRACRRKKRPLEVENS